MSDSLSDRTSPTLLLRLRRSPTDEAAWREFVQRYGPAVYRWCRHWGLQEADAEDVTQGVLLDLGRQMRTFEYDRSLRFRNWLHTVARRAWVDFMERRKRQPTGSGDTAVGDLLQSVAVEQDLFRRLDAECERELLEEAMARVRLRVEPHTFEAFRLMAVEGLSGVEAAKRLGIQVASAFQAKSRVQKMLRAEVEALDGAQ